MNAHDRADLARMNVRVSIEAREYAQKRPGYVVYVALVYWVIAPGQPIVGYAEPADRDAHLRRLLSEQRSRDMAVSA